MAFGRDGCADRRQADVSLACRRSEGEVLDMLVQRRRDSRAALRLMRKLLKKQGVAPKLLVTYKLRADSEGSRPRIRDDVAHHSDLMSLGVPG
jgi:transposase-like protein